MWIWTRVSNNFNFCYFVFRKKKFVYFDDRKFCPPLSIYETHPQNPTSPFLLTLHSLSLSTVFFLSLSRSLPNLILHLFIGKQKRASIWFHLIAALQFTMSWEDEIVIRDVTNAGLVVSDRIGREVSSQHDLEEALEASRYASHPYSTHPREVFIFTLIFVFRFNSILTVIVVLFSHLWS